MVEYKPRFIPLNLVTELINLYHLSRCVSNNKHDRMIWTSKNFSKEHCRQVEETAVYKDLDGLLQ